MAKFSFSDELIPLYADHVARTIAALRGKSGKVLVLDLDNTVWGGVIGDDGLEGIKVAQGDARGEAHLAVQRLALDLSQRGIVLAVSSKNTDEVAREPFEKHPEMLLKLEHIAVFQANWNDKATNIQAIAEELSQGLDAMVFLDDNPVERGLVRKLLPQVRVPELPEDPAWYARALTAGGYFETVAFAGEDLARAGFYQDSAKRASLRNQMGGVDAYLASLDMTITFQPFDATGRARIVQMSYQLPLPLKLYAAFRLIVAYPLFLYANFSGYIDIMIALARLMRVRLPENFDRPFSASSFLEFWSRWHMTLSNWFKTYVYNPLLVVLMRRISSQALEPLLGVFCFFATFFLVGIWHGRTSEFVVYGLLQGGGISTNKLWQVELTRALGRKGYKNLAKNPVYIALGRGLTFSWLSLTLFWLWANWDQIGKIFSALSAVQWIGVWLGIWLSATVVLALWERLRAGLLSIRTSQGPVLTSRYARVVYASALGLVAFVMTILLNQPAPGIVYKAF